MKQTIISLTTIPERVDFIGPVLESLASQGPPVVLWLERGLFKCKSRVPEVKGVTVSFTEVKGPMAKLKPALSISAATVITADDDKIYPKGWAAALARARSVFPFAAFCYVGRRLSADLVYGHCVKVRAKTAIEGVDIPIGCDGAAYSPSFFGDGFDDDIEKSEMNDDLAISAHLMRRRVPVYAIPAPRGIRNAVDGDGEPLHRLGALSADNVGMRRNDVYLKNLFNVAVEVCNG